MAVPNLDDKIEVAVVGEFDGTEEVVNVFQFNVDSVVGLTAGNYLDNFKELVEAILDIMDGLVTAYTIWRRFRVKNKTQDTATEYVELDAAHPGTVAGESLPSGVALLSVFRTTAPKIVLRKYVGVPGETMNEYDGQWTTAALVGAANFVTLMLAQIVTTESAFTYGHWSPDTLSWYEPSSGYINTEPAYQRRRRRGTGT